MAHPSYPNPTIVEALCEIHFKLASGTSWSPNIPGALWKEIADEFPDIEPITESGISFRIAQGGEIEQLITERKKYRFTHQSKKKIIQISENVFTVNVLAPYPGWERMKGDVLRAWESARRIVKPAVDTRIGLRYINKIQRRSQDELTSHWLRNNDFLPQKVLNSRPPFLLRLESRVNDRDRSLVTLASTEDNKGYGDIVFDIDCIREAETGTDEASVSEAIEGLHNVIWDIFSTAMTDNLLAHLKSERE